jgi:hypothetical protein
VQNEHVQIVHGDRNGTKILQKTHIFSLSFQLPPLKGKKGKASNLPHREKKDYKKDEVVFLAMFPPQEKMRRLVKYSCFMGFPYSTNSFI